jgi:hypothetical protein
VDERRRSVDVVGLVLLVEVPAPDLVRVVEPALIELGAAGIQDPLSESLTYTGEILAVRPFGRREIPQEEVMAADEAVPDVEQLVDVRGEDLFGSAEGSRVLFGEKEGLLEKCQVRLAVRGAWQRWIAVPIAGNRLCRHDRTSRERSTKYVGCRHSNGSRGSCQALPAFSSRETASESVPGRRSTRLRGQFVANRARRSEGAAR